MYHFLTLFNELPQNSRVCIYGTGEVSIFYKRLLQRMRKDVSILCFIDTLKSDILDGLPVIPIREIKNIDFEYNYIMLTTPHVDVTVDLFFRYDIHNYICIDYNKYFHLYNYVSLFTDPEFSSDPYSEAALNKIREFREMLKEEEDKELLDLIANARNSNADFSNLFYHMVDNITKIPYQYLHYINKDAIKNAFDCGGCLGETSILFLNHFKNIERVHMFEPLFHKIVYEPFSSIIRNAPKIKLVNFGLWSTKDELRFQEKPGGASCIVLKDEYKDETTLYSKKIKQKVSEYVPKIPVISIDEYIAENNIEKVDFIKMDIEGAEPEALKGALKTINKDRPQLAIAIYHEKEHLYEIPLYLKSMLKGYMYRLGHYRVDLGETVLYAIPEELYGK